MAVETVAQISTSNATKLQTSLYTPASVCLLRRGNLSALFCRSFGNAEQNRRKRQSQQQFLFGLSGCLRTVKAIKIILPNGPRAFSIEKYLNKKKKKNKAIPVTGRGGL
jgi:hypothetical protein